MNYKLLLGLFVFFRLLGTISVFNKHLYLDGIFGIIALGSLIKTMKDVDLRINSNSVDGAIDGEEKKNILLTLFITPIASGATYYYALKDKFPQKAKSCNKWSFIFFGMHILILGALTILGKK